MEEFIVLWITGALSDIPEEMVKSSFCSSGETNNLDGSQEDLVYEQQDELGNDKSFVRDVYESGSETEFEGFDSLKLSFSQCTVVFTGISCIGFNGRSH